jgi:hypothetical protein
MPDRVPIDHLMRLGYPDRFRQRLLELADGTFESVGDIERVLSTFDYKVDWRDDYVVESVSTLIERRRLMCLDAAILARGLLEGFPTTEAGILAIHRRDGDGNECGHAAAFYRLRRRYGAFARSNYAGLRSVAARFEAADAIAYFYAREYLRIGFTPLMFGTCSLEDAFGEADWRFSRTPLEGIVERIMRTYRFRFAVRRKWAPVS